MIGCGSFPILSPCHCYSQTTSNTSFKLKSGSNADINVVNIYRKSNHATNFNQTFTLSSLKKWCFERTETGSRRLPECRILHHFKKKFWGPWAGPRPHAVGSTSKLVAAAGFAVRIDGTPIFWFYPPTSKLIESPGEIFIVNVNKNLLFVICVFISSCSFTNTMFTVLFMFW